MKAKTKALVAITAIASTVGLAFATPIVNLISPLLSSGTHDGDIETRGHYALPDGGWFKVRLKTDGPSTIATQVAAYGVGGVNGWHAHAGMVLVTITSGTIQWFNENCEPTI
jgi:hypothetical protein